MNAPLPEGTTVRILSQGQNYGKIGTVLYHTEKRTRVRLVDPSDPMSSDDRSFHPKNLAAISPCPASSQIQPSMPSHQTLSSSSSCTIPENVRSGSRLELDRHHATPPSLPSKSMPVDLSGAPFVMGEHRIGRIRLLTNDQSNPIEKLTLAGYMLGSRIRELEYEGSDSQLMDLRVQRTFQMGGFRWDLLGHKLRSERTLTLYQRLQRPSVYYLLSAGPGLEEINAEDFLLSLAAFNELSPTKAASRVELLFTPAMTVIKKGEKSPLIAPLKDLGVECEKIEENCHEGCGYCPRRLVVELFGNSKRSRQITSIQVRMIVSGIGLIKGLLTVKEGIDKIQIPQSMVKAGPAESPCRSLILVKQAFPSKKNGYLEQYIKNTKPLCKSALLLLQTKLSTMIEDVLLDSGVPESSISDYAARKLFGKGKHFTKGATISSQRPKCAYFADTFCVGAADPTMGNCIPYGYVVIPGLPGHIQSVLVTRSPCMSKKDLLRLPVLQKKPLSMNDTDWSSLNARSFGDIYFGAGSIPLPNMISGGDLDGDLYFVLWEPSIVDSVKLTGVRSLALLAVRPKKREIQEERKDNNLEWFTKMQQHVADVGLDIRIARLIGKLYTAAKKMWRSEMRNDADCEILGNAYKFSLDLQKHGGCIELPRHLFEALPDKQLLRCSEA